jgi:RNA polymerase sigma-70 factor (ECF subfamily)
VPLLAFLAGIMRSLRDEQWRRRRRHDALPTPVAIGPIDDPERVYAAAETLAAIHRLFASDASATRVITGLLDGMTADEIRRRYGLSAVEYDTAGREMQLARKFGHF